MNAENPARCNSCAQSARTLLRVGSLAHDVNNLMVVALDGVADGTAEGREVAREALEAAALYSRQIVDRAVVATSSERDPVPLATHVTEQVQRLRAFLPAGVRLVLRLEGELCTTGRVDPFDLDFALRNLVFNAARAMERGGTVEVTLAGSAEACRLMVADDGPGVAPEDLPGLGRRQMTSKASGEGGAGLILVRRRLESAGATLSFRHREPRGLVAEVAWCLDGRAEGVGSARSVREQPVVR